MTILDNVKYIILKLRVCMVVLSWFRTVGWGAWWKKRVIWTSGSSAAWKCTVCLWSERSNRAADVSGFKNSTYPVQNPKTWSEYDRGHRGTFGELKAFFLLSCSCVVGRCHLTVVNREYLLKTTNAGNRPFWKKAAASLSLDSFSQTGCESYRPSVSHVNLTLFWTWNIFNVLPGH